MEEQNSPKLEENMSKPPDAVMSFQGICNRYYGLIITIKCSSLGPTLFRLDWEWQMDITYLPINFQEDP